MRFCKKCGESIFMVFGKPDVDCECKPFCIVDENGEEHTIHAHDSKDAALKYARKSNENGDYYLINTTVQITVNGELFGIGAEPDVHYSARAL